MANSLGSLVVSLGLDAAEYTRGLTKAEYQAKQFAQNTRSAILEVGKVLGGLAIAQQVYEATKAIIAEAAALDDLADATGASVEALSKLNNQAKIAGTDFATLQSALLKLSAGMAGTDEETTKAKEALKLLGVTTKDPAKAMQEVAVALDKYEDGVNKVGLAVALFGKQGGALLPVLKDMAQLQDVQATVTTKQAAEADELGKAWRRLSVESETFKNAILNDVVPALTEMLRMFNEARKASEDLFGALQTLAQLNPFASAGENVARLDKDIASLEQGIKDVKAAAGGLWAKIAPSSQDTSHLEASLARLKQAREIAISSQLRAVGGAPTNAPFGAKPPAPALPGGGGAKALKEQTTEAQRYLEALEKQNERTLELTHTEQFLRDVQMDRIKGLTPAITDQILKQTQLLDSNEALKKSEEERKKAAEETAKAEQRIAEATSHAIKSAMQEVEAIKQGNEQLREQLAFLKGGEEAVNRLTDAKLADVIATKEAELAVLRWGDANEMWIKATEDQIRLLKERQGLIGQVRLAEQLKKEAAALQDVKNLFADAMVDPLTDFVTGAKSAKDAFRDLVNDVTRQLSRLASQNIANAIFGGTNKGADVFGALAKLFAGGGGAAAGGWVSGFDLPAFASGGTSRGGWAMVGERGPEAVHLPRGAQVIPNDVLMARRSQRQGDINIHVNVPSSTSAATADQIATRTGLAVRRALNRNA
jgi:hypothetical protein